MLRTYTKQRSTKGNKSCSQINTELQVKIVLTEKHRSRKGNNSCSQINTEPQVKKIFNKKRKKKKKLTVKETVLKTDLAQMQV
jgi:hypothetical protein